MLWFWFLGGHFAYQKPYGEHHPSEIFDGAHYITEGFAVIRQWEYGNCSKAKTSKRRASAATEADDSDAMGHQPDLYGIPSYRYGMQTSPRAQQQRRRYRRARFNSSDDVIGTESASETNTAASSPMQPIPARKRSRPAQQQRTQARCEHASPSCPPSPDQRQVERMQKLAYRCPSSSASRPRPTARPTKASVRYSPSPDREDSTSPSTPVPKHDTGDYSEGEQRHDSPGSGPDNAAAATQWGQPLRWYR